jgi:uncharacterized LabA/DUF88 family protein
METNKIKINFAFIDGQNLNLGVLDLGWKLDFAKFRVHLMEKYNVDKAFLFIGYIPGNEMLYKHLQEDGYICIFKPTLELPDGTTKGNVDAEVVLHSLSLLPYYDSAVIVTGDGDFFCLINYLHNKNKLNSIIIPNKHSFSALLKFRIFKTYLRYVNDLREKLEYKKEKAP